MHGFVYNNGTFTTLNVPGANATYANAISNSGEVAGTYTDSSFTAHGFVYDNGTFTTLNAPGANGTLPTAINDRGDVAGEYNDSIGAHGFLASPNGSDTADATLGDLLSAHASQVSVSDLLPSASAISGGPPQSANTSGMMDQTLAAGASFPPFIGLESDQTATQVLMHGNGS